MTDEQRIKLEELMAPLESKEDLQAWISEYVGFTLPDQTLSRWSNSNPLDFVWRVYQAMINGEALAILALSGRDSGKTISLSIIDLLSLLHDKRSTIHIGMTTRQAERAKDYLEDFINRNEIIRNSVTKMNHTEIQIEVDKVKVGMEILSCTPKAVQGGHCSLLTFDEIASSMEKANVKAYSDAHGILGASKNGKPAIVVKITSRQTGASLAEIELEEADERGLEIARWTTIECTERCPDWRSGTVPTPLWINPYTGEKFTKEEFEVNVSLDKREGWELAEDTMDQCRTCPLAAACGGRLKHQKSTSPILRKIDDVINKIRLNGSWEWATAQILSLTPSKEGLVYFEFSERTHKPNWQTLWNVLTGNKPIAVPVTRDIFLKEAIQSGCTFYAGIDWGWKVPSTCVVICVDREGTVYVVEASGKTNVSDPAWVQIIKETIHTKYPIQMYIPDTANPGLLQLLRDAELPCAEADKGPGSVRAGINTIKRFLKEPGTGEIKLYLAPDLVSSVAKVKGITEEFAAYRKDTDASGTLKDDLNPVKEHDHYLDALRYIMHWLFGKSLGKVIFAGQLEQKPQTNNPTMIDLIQMAGIPVNDNRDEFHQMGQQPKKKPDGDDDDPDGNNSGGGLKFVVT